MLWRPIPACLQDLGSPDLARYVRSGTGYVTYASLDRVAARRLGWHRNMGNTLGPRGGGILGLESLGLGGLGLVGGGMFLLDSGLLR